MRATICEKHSTDVGDTLLSELYLPLQRRECKSKGGDVKVKCAFGRLLHYYDHMGTRDPSLYILYK